MSPSTDWSDMKGDHDGAGDPLSNFELSQKKKKHLKILFNYYI